MPNIRCRKASGGAVERGRPGDRIAAAPECRAAAAWLGVLAGAFLVVAACGRASGGDAAAGQSRAAAAGDRDTQPAREQGRLRVRAAHFEDEQSRPWRWRGVSAFLLPARYFAGQNIDADLQWFVRRERTVLRTFWTAAFADAKPLGWEQPWIRRDFAAKAHAFFELCASHGLRVEATALTYQMDVPAARSYVQQLYDIAAQHWNVFIEVANEPEANGIDPVAVLQGVNRRGVLSAYGLDPARRPREQWANVPVLDYGTTHDLQRDFAHSAWNTKDARDMQDLLRVPFVADEPIGVIDPGHANYTGTGVDAAGAATFGRVGGGGARTTNCDVIRSAAGIADLLTPGYTLHLQAGVEGRAPAAAEAVQDACAASLAEIDRFIPAEAQLGAVASPGMATFGLAWRAESRLESRVDQAFGAIVGDRQWVVVAVPAPTWQGPQPAAGWKIDAVGPISSIVRLERMSR